MFPAEALSSLRLPQKQKSKGDALNTATVRSDTADPDKSNNSASALVTIGQPLPATQSANPLKLGSTSVGGTAKATETLTNNDTVNVIYGTLLARNLDPAGPTLNLLSDFCSGQKVLPGKSCSFDISAACTTPGTISGSVTIPDNSSGSPETISVTGSCVLTSADLAVTKSVDKPTITVGDGVTFTLAVTNKGPDPATNLKVSDTLPANFDPKSITADNPLCTIDSVAGAVVCTSPTLAKDATATFKISAKSLSSGTAVNKATASADTGDPDNTNNTASATVTIVKPAPPTFSPPALDYGRQTVGSAAVIKTETVTNAATATLIISSVTCGSGIPNCAITSDTCSGKTVAPSGSCSYGVSVTCTAVGTISGNITETDNSSGSPETIPVTGSCANPQPTWRWRSRQIRPQRASGTRSSSRPPLATRVRMRPKM